MAEPAAGFERGFEHAAYSPVPSSPKAPSDIRGDESIDSAQSDLASLIRLGTIKQDAGSFAEAEECFRRALEIGDRREAIRTSISGLRRGDVLLIAGKGHETGQIIGKQVLPFSDHEAVAAALAGRVA